MSENAQTTHRPLNPKIMFTLDLLLEINVANRSSCLIGLFGNNICIIVWLPENQFTLIFYERG